ncbi:ABC transporter permease subunit [Nonomuraea salmonea]|uniref:ABC transporter permease subunit n=1 Tax=Nonomuraea salmonea TaxID=46181 RepID=UPI0031E6BEF7
MSAYTTLYETPGPRGVRRNRVLTGVVALALLAVAAFVYVRFDAKDQWAAEKWTPLLRADVWATFILPGLAGTLSAAVVGVVLAGLFGLVFATARLSEHTWVRVPAAVVVEFFRSVPLLLMIFFAFFGSYVLIGVNISAFAAVVFGLTLYNGSVIAEIVRAGVLSLPRGAAGGGVRGGHAQGAGDAARAAAPGAEGHDARAGQPVRGAAEGLGAGIDRRLRRAGGPGPERHRGELLQRDPGGHPHRGHLHRHQHGAGPAGAAARRARQDRLTGGPRGAMPAGEGRWGWHEMCRKMPCLFPPARSPAAPSPGSPRTCASAVPPRPTSPSRRSAPPPRSIPG